MECLQYSIQFCSNGRHGCREPPGNLSVSVEIGRDVVTDEKPTSRPAAIDSPITINMNSLNVWVLRQFSHEHVLQHMREPFPLELMQRVNINTDTMRVPGGL
ncbi:hypothetical protein E2C01_095078 [Portunus trituberculatus]|uniref:Uncharacterized protein n=1 Tax=Portunus trituberculatus TaxID=210409 RepID=A0A5B7JNX0_PORTR|nr:hypothetical protein [Portunus trituberculatus]